MSRPGHSEGAGGLPLHVEEGGGVGRTGGRDRDEGGVLGAREEQADGCPEQVHRRVQGEGLRGDREDRREDDDQRGPGPTHDHQAAGADPVVETGTIWEAVSMPSASGNVARPEWSAS